MHERKMTFEKSSISVMPLIMRFALYTLVIFAFTASLQLIVQHGDIVVFEENGPIEWIQFGCLVAASSVLIAGSSVISSFRELFLLLASISAFAAVRELDSLLDKAIPWIGWKVGFVMVLYAAGVAYSNRNKIKWQIAHFLSSPAFGVMWAAFIMAVPVAQLLGHGPFLESLLGDDYDRSYKRIIEESGEMVGYLLLLAGSIESLLYMKAARFLQSAQSGKTMVTQRTRIDRVSKANHDLIR
jgi:hypothetical protein